MQGSPHTISLVGIESPGVTAATPLARRVAAILLGTEENEGTRIKKKRLSIQSANRFRVLLK